MNRRAFLLGTVASVAAVATGGTSALPSIQAAPDAAWQAFKGGQIQTFTWRPVTVAVDVISEVAEAV